MKIAGIYPQKNLSLDPKIQHAVSEPYGLEMILAVASQQGHDVELFVPLKCHQERIVPITEEEMIERITEYKPDIAGFSMYTCQYPMGKRIAAELKKRLPGTMTIAGNRYPSYLCEKIEDPFDFFVVKEGEETFREFLREIENEKKYRDIKGLVIRENHRGFYTGNRQRNLHLDFLPNAMRFPVILNQVYRGISLPPMSEDPNYAIVEYSRCCYNTCKFCDSTGFWGNNVVFRSPQRVVEEMFELKEKGVDTFYFMDLNFTADRQKTAELCKEMIDQSLGAHWYCMSNTATLDSRSGQELMELMKKAGCYKIAWGVESTNDNSLEIMGKRVDNEFTTTEQTVRVLQNALDTGIINQGYYIIGFPWETEETIIRDAGKLKYIPIHIFNVGIFTPIPLSRFYKEMLEKGYKLDPDLENHDRNTLVYNHPSLDNEKIKALQADMHHNFYTSPEYLERVQTSCRIDSRFKSAFNDYFEFLGNGPKM